MPRRQPTALAAAWFALAALAPWARAADLRDVRGPLPLDTAPPFALTGALVVALALLFLAAWWLRQRRRRTVASVAAPGTDRLQRLAEDLRRGRLPPAAAIADLERLLRAEWAARAALPEPGLTSRDLRLAAPPGLAAADATRLETLLALFDRVKFAAQPATAGQAEAAIQAAACLLDAAAGQRPAA